MRANHVGDDVRAMLRSLFGGEIPELSQLLAAAREQALDRMIADALSLGADGVVAARMQSTILRSGARSRTMLVLGDVYAKPGIAFDLPPTRVVKDLEQWQPIIDWVES